MKLPHLNQKGQAHIVDISHKQQTQRRARASGSIFMSATTLTLLEQGGIQKGDVLAIARVAAIQAAKHTMTLIPLCHTIALTHVDAEFTLDFSKNAVHCTVTTQTIARTGVEMESLTAVSIGLLTIYDMCKALDKNMCINNIRLLEKEGGQSGHWVADKEDKEGEEKE